MKMKRVPALILAGITAFSLTVPAAAADESVIVEAELLDTDEPEESGSLVIELTDVPSGQAALEDYLDTLDEQMDTLSTDLEDVSEQLSLKEAEVEAAKGGVSRAQEEVDEQYDAMVARIQYMYETGNDSLLITLLEMKSVTDFMNHASMVSELSEYDRNKLNEYIEALQVLADRQEALESEIETLSALMESDEAKIEEINALTEEANKKIAEYAAALTAEELQSSGLQDRIDEKTEQVAELKAQAEDEAASRAENAENASRTESYADQSTSSTESSSSTSSSSESSSSSSESKTTESASSETVQEEEPEEEEEESDSGLTYLGNFKITAYCDCAICCGTAGQNTASGTKPSAGRTVAMGGISFGTKLQINGHTYTVEDRGTPYGHVDIFFSSHQEALNFGVKYADVYVVN